MAIPSSQIIHEDDKCVICQFDHADDWCNKFNLESENALPLFVLDSRDIKAQSVLGNDPLVAARAICPKSKRISDEDRSIHINALLGEFLLYFLGTSKNLVKVFSGVRYNPKKGSDICYLDLNQAVPTFVQGEAKARKNLNAGLKEGHNDAKYRVESREILTEELVIASPNIVEILDENNLEKFITFFTFDHPDHEKIGRRGLVMICFEFSDIASKSNEELVSEILKSLESVKSNNGDFDCYYGFLPVENMLAFKTNFLDHHDLLK